jgi:hypothetical protein
VSPPRSASVQRFSLVWGLSVAWKVVALAVFVYLATRLAGGGGL